MNKTTTKENEKLTEEALRKRYADEYEKTIDELSEKFGFKMMHFPKWVYEVGSNGMPKWYTIVLDTPLKVEKVEEKKSPVAKK